MLMPRPYPCLAAALLGFSGLAAPADVVMPRFTHPGAGQTIYIVMPDRFANGDPANDTGGLTGGPDDHGFDLTNIGYFHGGDFPGLISKLDYIRGLNVTTIWTTPPFKNNPVQNGSAGYHGYWITDFLSLDPHFGTNEDYDKFVREARARGLRVYLDIVVNHTADIIQYAGGKYDYVYTSDIPTRDASGQPFDERAVAYNGLVGADFPALSAATSFAYPPAVPAGREQVKHPAWLNDVTLYHNRGNSTFFGESATRGDFGGLDDLMTEHPQVVRGMIDIFSRWLERGVDGFRIDTMRHVNAAFWQAFNPALRARARALGRPDFLQFGEVMLERIDVPYLSGFSTGTMPVDATTDFPFARAARGFVSQGGPAAALDDFFYRDDYYTDHDSNVHSSVTLLGNYDISRWGYFLLQDNPGASPEQLADLARLGHGLMYLVRGMPVLHYGDEQGMLGRGGNDKQAREDMFPAQAPDFRDAPLLATTRTGRDDKFDPAHPFYRFFARLGQLRRDHVALRTGAMIIRATAEPGLFAFSRIDRSELVEYVVAFNNSRTTTLTAAVPTSQPAGARLAPVFDSRTPEQAGGAPLVADDRGAISVALAPLQFAVWRAASPLGTPAAAPSIRFATPADGARLTFEAQETDDLLFPGRRELRVEVGGGDGVAEVTFVMTRASRPGQYELLGTDDAAPYRVLWNPPADLAPDERVSFVATLNDLRGHTASAGVSNLTVAPSRAPFGIPGAHCPRITVAPPARVEVAAGATLELTVAATGTGDLEYQWFRDDTAIAGATAATYRVPAALASHAGSHRVGVHNLAGTTLSEAIRVSVGAAPAPAR
jgi:alpha-amylase